MHEELQNLIDSLHAAIARQDKNEVRERLGVLETILYQAHNTHSSSKPLLHLQYFLTLLHKATRGSVSEKKCK